MKAILDERFKVNFKIEKDVYVNSKIQPRLDNSF
jgi:hypothetical protein